MILFFPPRGFLIFLFFIIAAGSGFGQVSRDNAADYLEYGELQYQISVGFSDVSRQTPEEARAGAETLLKVVEQTPADYAAVTRAVAQCLDSGMTAEAAALAEEYGPVFLRLYGRDPADTNARNLLDISSVSGRAEFRDEAYERVRPLLESGTASVPTVLAAMNNRAENPELAFRIASFYQQVYPGEAELYFQAFLLTLDISLNRTLPALLRESFAVLESPPASGAAREEDVKQALLSYFDSVRGIMYLDLLDKAIGLDKNNYQYYVASFGFRALIRWFSQLGTLMMVPDFDMEDMFRFIRDFDPVEGAVMRDHLEKALALRPPADIEAYLAAALYNTGPGNSGEMRRYAELAVSTRPDMAKAWNALIFSILFENLSGDDLLEQTADSLESVLVSKIKAAGPDAYDYYVLASLQKYKLGGASPARRKEAIELMRTRADKSLETDETFFGWLVSGNAFLLQDRPEEALASYSRAEKAADNASLFYVYTNRGIALLVQGREEEGLAELNRALILNNEAEKAKLALALYK